MNVSERKRLDIVNAAIELFHDQGFAKTRMDDIAELACVSKRTVYNHFPSKEVLFYEIVQNMMAIFATGNQPPEHLHKGDIHHQLYALLAEQVELLCNTKLLKLSKLILAATLNNDVDMGELQKRLDKPAGNLQNWLQQQLQIGVLRGKSADDHEQWLLGILKGKLFWPQLIKYRSAPNKAEKQEICEQVARMFLREYATEP